MIFKDNSGKYDDAKYKQIQQSIIDHMDDEQ
jgi:histidine triad (HIT) family protein